MNEIEAALLVVIISLIIIITSGFHANHRRWWIRPLLLLRGAAGQYEQHFRHMRDNDPEMFFKYTRLTVEQFDLLLQLVGPSLEKCSIRTALSPEFRLLVTLRYTLLFL